MSAPRAPTARFHSQGAFAQIAPRPEAWAIRIFNPGSEPAARGDSEWGSCLRLSFWDVGASALGFWERQAVALDPWSSWLADAALSRANAAGMGWAKRPPLPRDAQAIALFLNQAWKANADLEIHCEYGKSRSGAAALAAQARGWRLASPAPHSNGLLLKLISAQPGFGALVGSGDRL